MNTNTELIVFAVIAAFSLVMATVVTVLPIIQQAHGQGGTSRGGCFRAGNSGGCVPFDAQITACTGSNNHAARAAPIYNC